ncbi:MAG: M23 family metallopeptidase [Saprospiraceae bacterium]|nr:M23 family metallopeptidase [Saprospiraceae bacterium]MDW8229683.1 M23 family metallopeptidase [Saprospiraceae bacterium]
MQKYLVAARNFLLSFRRSAEGESRSWLERLRDRYRLVIVNDETFEEVSSLKLSPLSVYIFLSSLIVGTAILVTLLIVYTPLKRYIPGYGDFQRDSEIAELSQKASALEKEINAQRLYNENLRKILTGDLADFTEEAVKGKSRLDTSRSESSASPADFAGKLGETALTSEPSAAAEETPKHGQTAGLAVSAGSDLPIERLQFIPPVSGEITARFDPLKNHFGIDVAAPRNTAIKAAADGVVILAGYTVETGYSIAIQHPHNIVTLYKHNSVLLKKAGTPVKAGEAIALIGNSGIESSGPHLHFELWYRGRPVNPSDYIGFR